MNFDIKPLPGDGVLIENKKYYIYKVNKNNFWCGDLTLKEMYNNKSRSIKFSEHMEKINALKVDFKVKEKGEEFTILDENIKEKIKEINEKVNFNVKEDKKNLSTIKTLRKKQLEDIKEKNKITKTELDENNFILSQINNSTYIMLCHRNYKSMLIEYNVFTDEEYLLIKVQKIGVSGDSIYIHR